MSPNFVELGTVGFGSSQSGHLRRSFRASGPEGHKPLDVLARGGHQGLRVHLLKPPQSEPPKTVPFLCLPEERLYPHRAFAQGLAIGFGLAVRPDPSEILLLPEAAAYPAPVCALCASVPEGTCVAG